MVSPLIRPSALVLRLCLQSFEHLLILHALLSEILPIMQEFKEVEVRPCGSRSAGTRSRREGLR